MNLSSIVLMMTLNDKITILLLLLLIQGIFGEVRRMIEVYHPFPYTPDGLIRQLQHAQQAVNRGSLSLAIAAKDGVVLAGERRQTSPLAIGSPKIGILDRHMAYVMSGIVPDGRYLIKKGRLLSQKHWFEYGEEIGLPALLMDLSKVVTSAHYRASPKATAADDEGDKKAGKRDFFDEVRSQPSVNPLGDLEVEARKEGTPARHFGVGFLFVGPEYGGEQGDLGGEGGGPWVIYEMGPSGMFLRWSARAIGEGGEKAEELLEGCYKEGLTIEACMRMAVHVCEECVSHGGEEGGGGRIEVATLTRDEKGQAVFRRLEERKIEQLRAEVAAGLGLVEQRIINSGEDGGSR